MTYLLLICSIALFFQGWHFISFHIFLLIFVSCLGRLAAGILLARAKNLKKTIYSLEKGRGLIDEKD
jgi:hypothetical protein